MTNALYTVTQLKIMHDIRDHLAARGIKADNGIAVTPVPDTTRAIIGLSFPGSRPAINAYDALIANPIPGTTRVARADWIIYFEYEVTS